MSETSPLPPCLTKKQTNQGSCTNRTFSVVSPVAGSTTASLPLSTEVTNSSGGNLLFGIGGSLIFGFVSGYFHREIPNVSLPFLDATLTGFSIWGTYLAAKMKIENWLVWIFVNILYIGVYIYKGMNGTAILYTVFLVFAFRGFYAWRKKLS